MAENEAKLLKEVPFKVDKQKITTNIFLLNTQFKKRNVTCFLLCPLIPPGLGKDNIIFQMLLFFPEQTCMNSTAWTTIFRLGIYNQSGSH